MLPTLCYYNTIPKSKTPFLFLLQSNMTNILQPTEQTKDSYNQTSEACGVQEQQISLRCHIKKLLVSGEPNQWIKSY